VPLDWAFDAPVHWDEPRADHDQLTEDLCVWTDEELNVSYFIRGVLEIPIVDMPGSTLAYGVWSSLSERSFARAVELFDDEHVDEPPLFGWLSNALPGYPETVNLPLNVLLQGGKLRPAFMLQDGNHPLVTEQRLGITRDRVFEIAELNMHGVA
jgi:hypothetical protein